MKRILSALSLVVVVVACGDERTPTTPDETEPSAAILDATHGDLAEQNPHFFWLPPMVEQPDDTLFGTFEARLQPMVRVVCRESTEVDCDADDDGEADIIVEFAVGSGLVVDEDHFHADFDTHAFELQPSTDDGSSFTTYRILALTPPLTELGGPFIFGFADFQLGENGREAKNLDTGEIIGLVDNRTLPIKFRVDRGAVEEELEANTPSTLGEDPALCQINCSVTVVEPDRTTEASLFDAEDPTVELTAVLITAGAIDETSVVVIDERETDDGSCAPGIDLEKRDCFRYRMIPDIDGFNTGPDIDPVRLGVCPFQASQEPDWGGSLWRILQFDADKDPRISRPPEVAVSDFLTCSLGSSAFLSGPLGEFASAVFDWLVLPLYAEDQFGTQPGDMSDFFWGRDLEMSRSAFSTDAVAGSTRQMTVEVLAVHPDPDEPVAGVEVTFERTAGTGAVSAASGFIELGSTANSVTLETDGNGQATVDWAITEGSNRLEVTSPDAEPAAGEPDPVAFDVTGEAAAEVAYVANHGSNNVSVIDVGTSSVTATIPVGGFPFGVAVTPDGSTAYVTNLGSDDVSVIEVATNSVTTTIPVGDGPRAVAVTPDGTTAYVAISNTDEVSVIEVATNSVTTTIPVGDTPRAVAVTPDGSTAYVTNRLSNDVSVIEVATNSVTTTIPVGNVPRGIAVTPDGSTAYVVNGFSDDVSVIEVATNSVTATIPVRSSPFGVAVTPDGSTAYVTNRNTDDVSVIEVATNSVTTTIPVGDTPAGVAVTADGSIAYVTNITSGDVSVIEVATNSVTATIPVGDAPRHVAFAGAGVVLEQVVLSSTTLTIEGTSVPYDATIQNNTGETLTDIVLQGRIEQGSARRAAGGALLRCGDATTFDGVLPAGTCIHSFTLNASNQNSGQGTLQAGDATAVFELLGPDGLLDELRIPITLAEP